MEEHDELELRMDPQGRISGTTDCGLDYAFGAWPSALSPGHVPNGKAISQEMLTELHKDCRHVYTGSVTFWLPHGMKPRFALEQLVQDIFAFHTAGVDLTKHKSGAEWWVQMREHGSASASTSIGFHWDKDEELVDEAGFNVHPQLSTVTYLTDFGAPTLILEERCSVAYEDEGGDAESVEAAVDDDTPTPFSDVPTGYLSYPATGSHVVFDGRWLHGAPSTLARVPIPKDETRFTLLVNIWIDHEPLGPDVFPESEVEHMSQCPARMIFTADGRDGRHTTTVEVDTTSTASASFLFGQYGWEQQLRMSLPDDLNAISEASANRDSHVVTLIWPDSGAQVGPTCRTDVSEVPQELKPSWKSVGKHFQRSNLVLVSGAMKALQEWTTAEVSSLQDMSEGSFAANWEPEQGDAPCLSKDDDTGHQGKRRRTNEKPWYGTTTISSLQIGEDAFASILQFLPASCPLDTVDDTDIQQADRVSFAIGNNSTKEPLQDSGERASESMEDGTWYLQLAGSTTWLVKPREATRWPSGCAPPQVPEEGLRFAMTAGDMLFINQRLWVVRTELPAATAPDTKTLSVSYSRDFLLPEGSKFLLAHHDSLVHSEWHLQRHCRGRANGRGGRCLGNF